MYCKIAFLVVATLAVCSAEYPAGLFPALCPNYPYCDNELLARYYPDGQPKPIYDVPMIVPHESFYPTPAKEWPAGVPPAACPNYPFCNVGGGAEPLLGFTHRLYPAGVPAAACPNYPYC